MAPRRRIAAVSVAVVIALLLLWWLRADPADRVSSDERTRSDPSAQHEEPRPIGADDEATPTSKLPWNRPGTSVSGRVTDEAGKPVAQADVCAVLLSHELPTRLAREPKCSKSGADGRYVLEVPPRRVAIAAGAPTFIPGHYDPPGDRDYVDLHEGQAAQGVDVVLRSGGVLVSGVVKDISGGVIEGASVKAHRVYTSNRAEGLSLARSDAQGVFSMWVEPGGVEVFATADGYADGSESGTTPGYTFEILLTPESVLIGRVVRKRDGTPVADAHVTLRQMAWWGAGTYTDEAGNFRIDRLEPGRYKPVARDAHSYGQLAESVNVGLGETARGLVIEVHPMPGLRGRVVLAGDDQTPCVDGNVKVSGRVSKHYGVDQITHAGEIEILGLTPDTYDVEVRCDGYVPEARYPELVVTDALIEGLVWQVKPGLGVKGVVIDGDGKPVARASVSARPVATAARAQQTTAWDEHTDDNGAFEMTGLVAGRYELHADHEDLVSPEVRPEITIVEGERVPEQTLVLERGGTVRGRVVDADQRAVANASVQLSGKHWGGGASTADDGSFVIEAVRPGELRLEATSDGSTRMRAPGTTDDDVQGVRVQVVAGEVTTVELVVEEQFGKISGKVVDADGGPVDDAFVHSTRESDSAATHEQRNRVEVRWGAWYRTPALTEQDGAFVLDALEVGKHTLMALREGGGEGVIEHIETGATGVVIQLGEGGTLSGKVELASGGVPKRFSMTVRERSQGVSRNEDFFETGGAWKIADLPAGKYAIGVTAAEGSGDTDVELAAGAERGGVTLTLTPKLDVTGTIVDLDTGTPVAGMKVSVSPRKGGGSFFRAGGDKEDITDERGRFVVRAAPAGAVRVTVSTGGAFVSNASSYGWFSIAAQIPSGGTGYELPPIRIAKSRAKQNQRGGDFGITLKQGDPEAEDEDVPLEIAVIRPGSPAAASDMKVGDVIIQVDGKDVTGANKYLYGPLTHVDEGDEVSFSLKRGGAVTLVAGKPP
ncbi:MAG: carboxypeptidase regulatory-like domain-containing protein [Deltaproteobacteria bacterium]|nr:carboxypeptidase regulatory-like domain-containing protein [Nannocystaceae bacterium]